MIALSRRRLLRGTLGLASASAVGLLAACQQAATPTTAPAAPAAPKPDAPVAGQPGTAKLQGKIVAWMPASCYFCTPAETWNQKRPDAQVEIVKGAQDAAKWQAALRSGQGGADIYQSQPSQIPKNMLHKQLYDWTDRMKEIQKDFVPFKLREVTHPKTNRIYGFPYQLGVVGMYYREDLMKKVGYTHDKLKELSWEGYIELGEKLKKDLDITLDASTPANATFFQMLLWLAGGSFTNKEGTEVTLDSDIAIDSMKKVKSLFDKGLMAPTDAGSEPFWTAAREGKVAAVWNATWFGGYFHRNITKPEEGLGQWRNVQLPYLKAGGPRAVNLGGSPMETPAFTSNPDLVWEVLRYSLATVEGALAAMSTGTVLSYVPALKTDEFQKTKFPYAGDWPINALWAEHAVNVPNTYYFTPVFDEAVTIFANYQPKIIKGELSVEAGMREAADKVREANQQYVRIMEQE